MSRTGLVYPFTKATTTPPPLLDLPGMAFIRDGSTPPAPPPFSRQLKTCGETTIVTWDKLDRAGQCIWCLKTLQRRQGCRSSVAVVDGTDEKFTPKHRSSWTIRVGHHPRLDSIHKALISRNVPSLCRRSCLGSANVHCWSWPARGKVMPGACYAETDRIYLQGFYVDAGRSLMSHILERMGPLS